MDGDELGDQYPGDPDRGLAIDVVLQAAEDRRRAEEHPLVGDLAGGQLESGIGAERQVVVEVFTAEGDGDGCRSPV
jgi:hypothetical protein